MTAMSPRLPSPPPPAEIQLGPKSPGLGSPADQESQQMEQTLLNANAKRRIHPGTKSSEMAAGPPLVPLNELDSAFQLQEHLAALHYHHTAHNTRPITRETASLLATPPPFIDKNLWLFELCRFLIAQCNSLIVGFLFDTPPCSASTCPEMRASEWQFLCAVHDQPKSCCAIDYCCHTLDWAANVVTNPKLFPSRFVAPGGGEGASGQSSGGAVKNLVNVFRRLHRMFAHAWFQHRGVFWSVEGQTGLYVFFKTVCDMYDTLPAENYKLPPEAEGLESAAAAAESMERGGPKKELMPPPTILQRSEDDSHLLPSRTNTRRHIRGSPSTGSAVTTVMEADEDENTDMTSRLGEMRISAPETVEEDESEVEVPVIVEQSMMEETQAKSPPPRETTTSATEAKSQSEPHLSREEPVVSQQEVQIEEAPGLSEPEMEAPSEEGQEVQLVVEEAIDGQDETPENDEDDTSASASVEEPESDVLPEGEPSAAAATATGISTHDFAAADDDGDDGVEKEEKSAAAEEIAGESSTEEGSAKETHEEEDKSEEAQTKDQDS